MELRVSPDGKTVTGLYSDDFDWSKLGGRKEVTRATDVRYNNEEGEWEIVILSSGQVLPDRFARRKDAINHEIEYLNENVIFRS